MMDPGDDVGYFTAAAWSIWSGRPSLRAVMLIDAALFLALSQFPVKSFESTLRLCLEDEGGF